MKTETESKLINVRPVSANGNTYCPIAVANEADAAFISVLLAYASDDQIESAYVYARKSCPTYHTEGL